MQIAAIVIGVIIALVLIYLLVTYNGFIRLKTSVEEAFATMDVYLKKRWDLIPNIVETVKGYAEHEKSTLDELVDLRGKSYGQLSSEQKIEENQKISSALSKLIAVAEAYPDLKANTMFLDLNSQLQQIESDIANSRKYYNGVVKQNNIKVQSFPSNIVAGMFKFTQHKMFEIESSERNNVQVKF